MGLFGKSQERNPKDMEWSSKLRKESYALDRQIRSIQREEEKLKRSLREAAKKNDKEVCTILAKEMIRSRKAVNKIYTSKAHINSVQLQMKNQMATIRVAGSLAKSTEVMQAMQALVKLPEVAASMREMSKEMMKAGIIEEMIDETMESLEDVEEMEEEAQKEIDKVLWEITAGKLGEAPAAPMATPATEGEGEASGVDAEAEDDEEDMKDMQSRLQALRS
ncbi:charged multivesicular body protein 3 isoform X2 [Toxorhynchites rutilus septentrionalis]|uniref:charged multivesicular body protein 3 isoform X2 n=1 Tax=Toxorhynchites rutilus septentrionalis TaxID=329112 RepID=UPI0024795274|nr:charged multivesicular body protein 3 isoform X2 [Toxorhynchites rutilus septentrionalis]